MEISFDPAKRASNQDKHGLDLSDAAEMLDGLCLHIPDVRFEYGEDRWTTLGMLRGQVVACAWAEWPDDLVRVISFRKATKYEQAEYLLSQS